MSVEMKQAVLEMLSGAKRIGKGQRWVIEMANGKRCLLKTNTKNSLMVRTTSGDIDAEIIGFGEDVTHVLIAMGTLDNLRSWLVPIETVEREYRENHRQWLEADPDHSRNNQTWVLRDLENRFNGFEFELQSKALTPEEARRGLAVHFGTSPEKIRIAVDV